MQENLIEIEESIEKNKKEKGNKPDFRIVQPGTDTEGKSTFTNVGAMWKNISKQGNEFYTLKIGDLKLLVFKNDFKND